MAAVAGASQLQALQTGMQRGPRTACMARASWRAAYLQQYSRRCLTAATAAIATEAGPPACLPAAMFLAASAWPRKGWWPSRQDTQDAAMQPMAVKLLHSRFHVLGGIKCNVSKGGSCRAGVGAPAGVDAPRPLPQVDAARRNAAEQLLKLLGRRGGV
jgi:hypothetical protein